MKSILLAVCLIAVLAVPCYAIEGEVGVGVGFAHDKASDIDVDNTALIRAGIRGSIGPILPYATLQYNMDSDFLNVQSREVKAGARMGLTKSLFIDAGYKIERTADNVNLNTLEIYTGYKF